LEGLDFDPPTGVMTRTERDDLQSRIDRTPKNMNAKYFKGLSFPPTLRSGKQRRTSSSPSSDDDDEDDEDDKTRTRTTPTSLTPSPTPTTPTTPSALAASVATARRQQQQEQLQQEGLQQLAEGTLHFPQVTL